MNHTITRFLTAILAMLLLFTGASTTSAQSGSVNLNETPVFGESVTSDFLVSADSSSVVYHTDEVRELYSVSEDPLPCQNVNVSTFTQLEAAIADYNTNCGNGTTLTVTVNGTIFLDNEPTPISNATTAKLVIQGDGNDGLNGESSFQLINIQDGDVTVSGLTLRGGLGSGSGGAISATSATLTVTNSTFTNNSAPENGGAVYLDSSNATITNSTFSGNSAANGGGLFHNSGTATVTNSTFSGNSSTNNQGGGIHNLSNLTLNNNILANSTSGFDCFNNGGTVGFSARGTNIIESNASGGNACGTVSDYQIGDPQLGTLANNGGPVFTMLPALSSIAIDRGDAATAPATDARGIVRPQISADDIGAVEVVPPPCQNYTVATQAELENALFVYAFACGNGENMTVTVNGTITLTRNLPRLNNTSTAKLTIQGDGDDILDGASSYSILNVSDGDITVNTLTLQNGLAGGGAAIRNDVNGSVTVNNVTFSGNATNVSSGGAIFSNGSLNVNNSTFSNNKADQADGGAIYASGSANINSSTFSGNSALFGGALQGGGASVIVTNSTFFNNSSTSMFSGGSAIGVSGQGNVTLTNSTVSGNNAAATTSGGSVYINSGGTLNLNNTILANSTSGFDCYNNGGTVNLSTGTSNLIESNATNLNFCGTPGNFIGNIDPELGALQNNGGPVFTMLPAITSQAIDSGDATTAPATDAIGTARPQGSFDDLGAVEVVPLPCQNVTVATQAELEAAIFGYNKSCGNGEAMTITVNGTITLTRSLNSIFNLTTAKLTIKGDGDDIIDGASTYSILEVSVGDLTIDTLTIQNAAGSNSAIVNFGTLAVNNSSFINNASTNSFLSGAIYNEIGKMLTVTNSTFSGNSGENGGAITSAGTLLVTNSTFFNNSTKAPALGGGAIHVVQQSSLTLTNSTLSGNTALSGRGGALYVGSGSTANLNNTILANSTSGSDCYNDSGTVNFSTGTSNLIETDASNANACGTVNVNYISADPILGSLANNGGSVQTLALLPGSPAINAGNNAAAVDASNNSLATDARGQTRIVNTTVDLGAVEITPFCQNVTATTQAELEAAIIDYNTGCINDDTKMVTVNGTITLASALSQVNNSTTAKLTIQGDGNDAISGADSFRILDVNAGNVTIETLTLQNGRNTQILRTAGGIYIATANATVTINNSTLTANQASTGGAIEVLGGTLNVTNSTFSSNVSANGTASTINVRGGGQVTIVNSTFVNNRAARGTTLDARDTNTNVTITNSTFFNNVVNNVGIDGLGSGSVQARDSATITLNNTILAKSTNSNAAVIPDCRVGPGGVVNLSSGTSNLIENGSECGTPGVNFIQADPLLGALANNGGSVQTLALLPGSPAINAGNNAAAVDASSNPLTTDARGTGFPRILGGLVDLGAFEYSSSLPTDVNTDGIVSPADAVFVVNRIGQTKDNTNARADVNNDGVINQTDVDLVIAEIGMSDR